MAGRVPVNDKILARAHELLVLKRPIPGNRYFPDRAKLRQIISGKVKSVDVDWWREENGVTPSQVNAKAERDFKAKLAKIETMADPARNPNEPQRKMAEEMLAQVRAAGPPKGSRKRSAPGLEEYDREWAKRQPPPLPSLEELLRAKAARDAAARAARQGATKRNAGSVNTTKPQPKAAPVNTTKAKAKPSPINTTKATEPKPEPVNTTTPKKPRAADRHREPNRDRHSPGYMRDYMRRRRAAQRQAGQ
jgi:hypothetical protein